MRFSFVPRCPWTGAPGAQYRLQPVKPSSGIRFDMVREYSLLMAEEHFLHILRGKLKQYMSVDSKECKIGIGEQGPKWIEAFQHLHTEVFNCTYWLTLMVRRCRLIMPPATAILDRLPTEPSKSVDY